jgi:hypothetical protein
MRFAERDPKPLERGVVMQIVEAVESMPETKSESGAVKYSVQWLAEELNGPILTRLHTRFRYFEKQEADLVDFVKLVLEEVVVPESESVPLVVCTIDFFRRIAETFALKKGILFKHVTDFLIDV